jgi:hypothetical protein
VLTGSSQWCIGSEGERWTLLREVPADLDPLAVHALADRARTKSLLELGLAPAKVEAKVDRYIAKKLTIARTEVMSALNAGQIANWRSAQASGLLGANAMMEWIVTSDESAGIIRIDGSKNDEPRTLPYSVLPELADLIAHRREVTDAVQRKRGMKINYVFHRNGERIREFRRSWKTSCIAAGLGHEVRLPDVLDAAGKIVKKGRLVSKVALRIPHDYRRSAARNLSRAGVPEGVIMKICGWKTRTVFDRYRIVAERDLAEGLAKLAGAPPKAGGAPRIAALKSGR